MNEEILAQIDKKKAIYSWALYDWANSAFATTVMAGFLPDFFRNYYAVGLESNTITTYLALANALASLIIVFLDPILGAIADKMSGKKRFLTFFAFQGILMTGLLVVVAEGFWYWALLLYVLGTVGFSRANTVYDSLLPAVASEKKIDFVSSLGFSLGYIGGGLLFIVNVAMYMLMDD
ncbi:MAG: MFS transporter, partial [Promethearchaeota archaeon]